MRDGDYDEWLRRNPVSDQLKRPFTREEYVRKLEAERDALKARERELVEALNAVLAMSAHGVPGSISYHDRHGAMDKARAVLAKARL